MPDRRETLRIEKTSERFNVPNRTERIFGVYLEDSFPGSTLSYEKDSFTIKNGDGTEETAKPDWKLETPYGRIIYFEVTKDRRNGSDPNERERRIMRKAAPNNIFVVVYADTLKKIQRVNPAYDFFKSERKKKKARESLQETQPKLPKLRPGNLTQSFPGILAGFS